jgi:CubicO group peptidase (beta-lactamase class C family)
VPAIDSPLSAEDGFRWEPLVEALARQAPFWDPGTKHGYHAVTFGHLVGEVVRRVSGMTLGTYFRKHFAEPLGIDFRIGFGPEHDGQSADIIPAPLEPPAPDNALGQAILNPSTVTFKAFMVTPLALTNPMYMNTREWRAAEVPAANGHGNARALATIYGALANGGSIGGTSVLRPETVDEARAEQSYGEDAVLVGIPTRFGRGFLLEAPEYGLTKGSTLFGHPGMGGSFGFADPEAGLGMGYAMNKMILSQGYMVDPRWKPMMDAVYDSL